MVMNKKGILSFVFGCCTFLLFAQKDEIIDGVIATVGDKIVLKSELEAQIVQYISSGAEVEDNTRCLLFEDLLFQKLLLNQADIDSVEVDEAQVQSELDRRIRYFIAQIGSEKKLEEYYKKPVEQIKEEFHDNIKEQLLVQQMQSKITGEVKVTPAEVRDYLEAIPKDSLPYLNSEVQIAQIVKKPEVNAEEKERIRERLIELRNRVLKGESFATLAVLYSEDPGSSKQRGELGFLSRNDLVPEFSAAAFVLKPGEVSEIVETKFGFHIIQMIEQRGETANVRHILLVPKVSPQDLLNSKEYLDSISDLMNKYDTLTFDIAARTFSDDKETKMNSGLIVNPETGNTKFEVDMLGSQDPNLFFTIDKMEIGEISKPILMEYPDGSKAYRLVKLISRSDPHIANLIDDYQRIQEVALMAKQNKLVEKWMNKKTDKTYINIHDKYKGCNFQNNWIKAQ